MSLETAIFVTTFAILGANLLLSGKQSTRHTAARERTAYSEIDELVRPVLLFRITAPMAQC